MILDSSVVERPLQMRQSEFPIGGGSGFVGIVLQLFSYRLVFEHQCNEIELVVWFVLVTAELNA
ncbi:hypothetical protein J6590_069945, partial [Homalodisca vitripennis]